MDSSRSIREEERVTNHIHTGLPALKSLTSGLSSDGACAVCFAGRSNRCALARVFDGRNGASISSYRLDPNKGASWSKPDDTRSGSTPQGSKTTLGSRLTQAVRSPALFAPMMSKGLVDPARYVSADNLL
jgi:hypothetical protein